MKTILQSMAISLFDLVSVFLAVSPISLWYLTTIIMKYLDIYLTFDRVVIHFSMIISSPGGHRSSSASQENIFQLIFS